MFKIDDWGRIAKYCAILAIIITFISLKLQDSITVMAAIRAVFTSASIAVLIFYAYGKWAWRGLWKLIPQLNDWVFPDLNGSWKGHINSNWLIVRGLLPEHSNDKETRLSEYPITFEIKQNLFGIYITMNTDNIYSTSNTIVVVPEKNKQSGQVTLYELYENRTISPEKKDNSKHYGAGVLVYRKDNKSEYIEGNYWTERNWRNGLNTAGSIKVERVRND